MVKSVVVSSPFLCGEGQTDLDEADGSAALAEMGQRMFWGMGLHKKGALLEFISESLYQPSFSRNPEIAGLH